MRLIDADALLEKANVYRCDFGFVDDPDVDVFDAVKVEHIENAPTVDAEPVRHGKWVYPPINERCCCSVCGRWSVYGENGYVFPYCPNCGARMDGGNSDGT